VVGSCFSLGGIAPRLVLVASVLALEWILIATIFSPTGTGVTRFAVPFCALFLALAFPRVKGLLPATPEPLPRAPFGWAFLAAHVASLVTFLAIYSHFIGADVLDLGLVLALFAAAILSIAFAALAFIPSGAGAALLRRTESVWMYATLGGLVTWAFVFYLGPEWMPKIAAPLTALTLRCVRTLVGLFAGHVFVDPLTQRINTSNFGVRVDWPCSGIEGLSLMLVFSITWLWFVRRESRFPQALLLIPAALVVTWLANVARIAALILIGHMGAAGVALGGFHSKAGWIAFNGIALAFVVAVGHLPWLSRDRTDQARATSAGNPPAPYVMPFLVIVAASLVSQALSGPFEWLYPLRLVAAVVALWLVRSRFTALSWTFGWPSVGLGAGVFVLWVLLDAWTGTAGARGDVASGLADLPAVARVGWLACRVAATVITVPIAEELAFRGYLARRVMAADFESVSFRALTPLAILVSSAVFGFMHGGQWFAGIVAGVVYAVALRRRGRIGDAVMAHATTNGLLAIWSLARGEW
jgi:exosortase E/protease (VPEID-CTERM system)